MRLAAMFLLLASGLTQARLVTVEPRVTSPTISVGDTVQLDVFVTDVRESAEGILSVFLDLEYDAEALGMIPDSLTFGRSFANLQNADTSVPGIVDETGAFVTGIFSLPPIPTGVGGQPELLYSVSFRALEEGQSVITTNHADNLPLNATTLFGINDGIAENDIEYGTSQIMVVPEPAGALLFILSVAALFNSIRNHR